MLKIDEDTKKREATVMTNNATGKERRTNQVGMAKCSYLDAFTCLFGGVCTLFSSIDTTPSFFFFISSILGTRDRPEIPSFALVSALWGAWLP